MSSVTKAAVSRWRLVAVVVLLLAVAYVAASPSDGGNGGPLSLTAPLSLSRTTATPGDTVSASVTYENTGGTAVTVNAIAIRARNPSGAQRDFAPALGPVTVQPGASVSLTARRTFLAISQPGDWTVYASVQDSSGLWHDEPAVTVTLNRAVFDPVTYAGSDYVDPRRPSMPPPCNSHYTFLTATCYATVTGPRLQQDIDFMAANRLGRFHRLWVSLDQLFSCFDAVTGYCGYDTTALANTKETLHKFANAGMQVAIVVFAQGNLNHFRYEALDGNHPTMRANYLRALQDFVRNIGSDPVAVKAVAVLDLMNEIYFQGERALEGKVTIDGTVCDQSCLDNNVIRPWLVDMYDAARAAAPGFLYTASDTGRLLRGQSTWIPYYPVDIYDVHVYDLAPWNNAFTYAMGSTLPKPWFVGEAGCNPGNVACTYDGNNPTTVQVDGWWLDNLRNYGAKGVLIEGKVTLFTENDTPSLTQMGRLVQAQNP
jgi:hypothetical protein